MDYYSPAAPAHINALVLPVGRIQRQRFIAFLQRLQAEASVITLEDVEKSTHSDAALLAPKLFPQGSLLYRYSSAAPSEQQQQLSPFELFREPLLILGVVDGSHLNEESSVKELGDAATYLKERHPRVVHRQLVVLKDGGDTSALDASSAIPVANAETDDHPSLRAAVCEISGRFLSELSTYANATHASPTITTPGQTARSLQRTTSLKEEERRPGSGRATPPHIAGVSSPDEGSPARPATKIPPLPATSFDQIPGVVNQSASAPRPDSRSSNKGKSAKRSSSQDRVSVQGFGSSTSQEKSRMRGKARVGIVFGSIYMMAGQWGKALPVLVEHTSKARSLQDHLWHAKGLENTLVCMILLARSGVDFQVPSICEPVTDRSGPSYAARIAAETKAAAEGTKQQLQLFRLSVIIPNLTRLILSLYRSAEGSLELPFLVIAEATVRMSKLLAMLGLAKGHLSPSSLNLVVVGQASSRESVESGYETSAMSLGFGGANLSKSSIADVLAQALPTADDGVAAGDHMRLIAGVASVYSLLRLDRKRAITIKELVTRLTRALIQARKVGAAEMGIHPAASLSNDTGAETLLAIAEESRGINDLMADVSSIYGANLSSPSQAEHPVYVDTKAFGSSLLKFDLLRELAGFCEASPDPYGVLLLSSSLLRAAGPNAALDITPGPVQVVNAFSREQQMHLATVIHRTVSISRQLGLSDVQATYWDPFLVRGIEILQPSGDKAVIDRSKINKVETAIEQPQPGNPLLYDPNASRPGTAEKQIFLLVREEASECVITLQNPFDIPVDIEQLDLIADGVELSSHHEPVTLGPLRFQQVSLMVTPQAVGSTKITGCRIKMQGCFPQVFPIISEPWSAKASPLLKNLGLNAGPSYSQTTAQHDLKSIGLEPDTVSASTIDVLPVLSCEPAPVLHSGLMLLEGESRSLALTLRNTGSISARVFEVKDSSDVLRFTSYQGADQQEPNRLLSPAVIAPGELVTFNFEIDGKAGVSHTQAAFFYTASDPVAAKYARVVTVPLEMTVNAALQVQTLDVMKPEDASDDDVLLVSFDVRNAWPKSITYQCMAECSALLKNPSDELPIHEGVLAPGELRRINLLMPHAGADGEYEEDAIVVKETFLNRFGVSWKMDHRAGAVDLQSLSLSPESLAALRGTPILISVSVTGQNEREGADFAVGSFVCVRVTLSNRSGRSAPLYVGLSAAPSEGLRDERRMAVVGTLQRLLPPLGEGEEKVVEFVIYPLLAGLLQMEALVRPVSVTDLPSAGWVARRSLSLSVV